MNNSYLNGMNGTMRLILLIGLLQTASAGNEDRTHEAQRLAIAERAERILIDNTLCQSRRDCQTKKLLFVSPFDGGVSVKLYAPSSVTAARQISDLCSQYFFGSDGAMNIKFQVFGVTKDEELERHFWQFTRPIMEINLQRSK